ncbi:MAG: cytochrome c [Gemmatimonadota bacterium]|nr:cytochrome c [Gemmatimonadota bacterium]
MQNRSLRPSFWTAATVALVATFALQSEANAQATFASSQDNADVTYAADVATIIQENCTVCHRSGGIGPMELVTYEDVRLYAPLIKIKVRDRLMPPYYYDTDIGIQELQHDWRLSQEDINTVVAWVDQGAPLGDPADMPPPANLRATDEWSLAAEFGPPDLLAPSSPIDIPAAGNDIWYRPIVEIQGLPENEERCIKALQVKPRGDAVTVVHHANSTFQLLQDDGSFRGTGDRATEYAMGKLGEIIPDGVCRRIPAGSHVRWDIHMYPGGLGATAANDVIEDNVVELGIWLHPADYEYEYRQDLVSYNFMEGQRELLLPPNSGFMTQGFRSWDHPVRIDSFQPHGHLRLRSASLEIFYPQTGRTEIVGMVSNWSATWHQSHIFEDHVAPLIPTGAVVIMKQWFDNTSANPNNPDPDQWVDYGQRTADEMSHFWMAVSHLDEEGYEKIVEEREAAEEEQRIAVSN